MNAEQKNCRICQKPFHTYGLGEKNGYKFEACTSCGSVMTNPWPTPADLDTFFGDIQPEIVHVPNPAAEIARIKKLLMKVTDRYAGRRFLDISCRQGYAAMAAKELGFQAKGIDPHDFFVAFAKDQYDVALFEPVTVPAYAARREQAEGLYSVESLCEQPDIDGYMAAVAKILAPGGALYLQEPDGNSFHLPRDFTRWMFADPPLNFAYISVEGMKSLLARHGLKIQKKFFTWGPFMRLIVVSK